MRLLLAALPALVAAMLAGAAKPPTERDFETATLRIRAIAECTSQEMERVRPREQSPLTTCQCAVDRIIAAAGAEALNPLIAGEKGAIDEVLAPCRAQRDAGLSMDEATRTIEQMENTAKALDRRTQQELSTPRTDETERARSSEGALKPTLGLPGWTWLPLTLLIGGVIYLLFGRRRRSDDLLGPPPSRRPRDRRSP